MIWTWDSIPAVCTTDFSATFYSVMLTWESNFEAIDAEIENGRDIYATLSARFDSIDTALADLADGTGISANAITEPHLSCSNSPTTDYVLSSDGSGGFYWAVKDSSGADTYQSKLTGAGDGPGYAADILGGMTAHTADATLTAAQCRANWTHTNTGSTGEVELTLPTGVAGYYVEFLIDEAQYLKIICPAGVVITYGSVSTATGGYIRSATPGVCFGLRCMSATEWRFIKKVGGVFYDK